MLPVFFFFFRVAVRFAFVTIYVNKGGNKKTMQTIHKTLHKPYILFLNANGTNGILNANGANGTNGANRT